MQGYSTTIGVIQMRQNKCSISVIQDRYRISSGTVQLILKRFNASGFNLEQINAPPLEDNFRHMIRRISSAEYFFV